jgi:hypothetical protein
MTEKEKEELALTQKRFEEFAHECPLESELDLERSELGGYKLWSTEWAWQAYQFGAQEAVNRFIVFKLPAILEAVARVADEFRKDKNLSID